MTQQSIRHQPFIAILIAALIVVIAFTVQGNIGFSLWDEGFLWYGAQRVMHGEVPLQDFMAYDPGRYYWSAAFMSSIGNSGIMALRMAIDSFQLLGIFVGLILISRTMNSRQQYSLGFLVLAGVILALWMFPRHKIFDLSLSIFLTGALSFAIEKPTNHRFLISGLCVGLVAFFGRNHGLYGVVASLFALTWSALKTNEFAKFPKSILSWGVGVLIGFSPILLMGVFIPGFATAFVDSIRLLFEMKTTNISLPIPWPWKVSFSSGTYIEIIRQILIGLFFLSIPLVGLFSVAWLTLQKIKGKPVASTVVAASFLTIPYAHYAYSRADIGHLAQGIFPFLILCLALLSIQSAKLKWIAGLTLGIATFWIMSAFQPAGQCSESMQCENIEISGSILRVDQNTADNVKLLRVLGSEYAPDNQNIIIAPFWPGAYALLNKKSPMWTIYALWPRSDKFQLEEISRIKSSNPTMAVVFDFPLDGRDDLRFKNTYPLIDKYIKENFERISPSRSSDPALEIYKAKTGASL